MTHPKTLDQLRRPDRYPRSSGYEPEWLVELDMGPHPLWQLENLLETMPLTPGMRVLDLGPGGGATSVFLVQEFGVEVVAAELWVPAEALITQFRNTAVEDRVTAVNADVRNLPFADEEFDAVISIDAFEYFGTDVHVLPLLMRILKPGGRIGMSTPALRADPYDVGIPDDVFAVFGWEAATWHSPEWWHKHWELSGMVDDIQSRWQPGGLDDWLIWERAVSHAKGESTTAIIELLEADHEERLGFVQISARTP